MIEDELRQSPPPIQRYPRFASEPRRLNTPGGGYGFRSFDPDGHVVVNSPNLEHVKAFYEDKLGFRLPDWLGDQMAFMRCATGHHSFAIAHGPHAALNHVSFEMGGIDKFMRGTGRLLRCGDYLLRGPGRHGAGESAFSYFLDPNGNVSEHTTSMEQIVGDAWQPWVWQMGEPDTVDQWGTARRQAPPGDLPV